LKSIWISVQQTVITKCTEHVTEKLECWLDISWCQGITAHITDILSFYFFWFKVLTFNFFILAILGVELRACVLNSLSHWAIPPPSSPIL
jgi:hypothetical protein